MANDGGIGGGEGEREKEKEKDTDEVRSTEGEGERGRRAIYGNWQERRTNFRKRAANTGPGVSRGEG